MAGDSSVASEGSAAHHLRRALTVSPGFVVPVVISMVQILVVIRVLPVSEYAAYILAMTTITVTCGVLGEPLANGLVRFHSGGDVLAASASRVLIFPVLAFACLAVTAAELLLGLSNVVAATIAVTVAQILVRQQTARLRAEERLRAYGLVSSLVSVTLGVAVVSTAVITGSAAGLLWATALTYGTAAILLGSASRTGGSRPDGRAMARFLGYAAPIGLTAIAGQTLNAADRFLVSALTDKAELASYYANYVVAERPVGLVFAPILAAAQPMVFRLHDAGDSGAAAESLNALMRLYVCLAVPLAVFLGVFDREVSLILAGDRYAHSAAVIPLVAAGATLWNIAMIVHQPLEIARRTMVIAGLVTVAALINVASNLALIPRYGGEGAAASTVIAFASYLALVSLVLARTRQSRLRFPFRLTLTIVAVSSVTALSADKALQDAPLWARLTAAALLGAATWVLFILADQRRSKA